MKNYTSTQFGWMVAGAIYSGTIVLIISSIFIAELATRYGLFGGGDLDQVDSFFLAQFSILSLLLAVVFISRKLRGFIRVEPAPATEKTFPAGIVVQYLWAGSTLLIPLWLASFLFHLLDFSHSRLVISAWLNFCIGMLGLRLAAGYARSLRDEDDAAEAAAGQAGESNG